MVENYLNYCLQKTFIFGDLARLDENAPTKLALHEAIRKTNKPQERPKTTLLIVINEQLQQINISKSVFS